MFISGEKPFKFMYVSSPVMLMKMCFGELTFYSSLSHIRLHSGRAGDWNLSLSKPKYELKVWITQTSKHRVWNAFAVVFTHAMRLWTLDIATYLGRKENKQC